LFDSIFPRPFIFCAPDYFTPDPQVDYSRSEWPLEFTVLKRQATSKTARIFLIQINTKQRFDTTGFGAQNLTLLVEHTFFSVKEVLQLSPISQSWPDPWGIRQLFQRSTQTQTQTTASSRTLFASFRGSLASVSAHSRVRLTTESLIYAHGHSHFTC